MTPKGIRNVALAVAAAIGLAAMAAPAMAQDKKITVWWVKGFYKSEDDALLEAIRKFEAKTGIKVELSQYAVQDMIRRRWRRWIPEPRRMSPMATPTTCRRPASGRSRASSRISPTS